MATPSADAPLSQRSGAAIPKWKVSWLVMVSAAALLIVNAALAESGQWELTGSMNTARENHTATLLLNGQVLVAGGSDHGLSVVFGAAELYDPAMGIWTVTGSLQHARRDASATLLPNGNLLVAGGFAVSAALGTAELYDPLTGSWIDTSRLADARGSHTATLLADGKVLVAGGATFRDYLASAELYDPARGTWTDTGSLATARSGHTATLLPDGRVLVVAGNSDGSLASAELYEPTSGTWTDTGSLATARSLHTATLLPSGKVLVVGGSQGGNDIFASAELYDPKNGSWTATGSLAQARAEHTATLLSDGRVLVAGGYYVYPGTFYLASAEVYDPASGTWTATGSLGIARSNCSSTLLPSGNVLVAGGYGGTSVLDSAELYDPGIAATSVKGSGFIDGHLDEATFSVRARLTGDQRIGSFSFSDPAAGLTITDASIRRLSINGNSANFNGRADLGGGNRVTFNVSVADNGPGTSDTLSITVSNGYSAGGTLIDGNIRIY